MLEIDVGWVKGNYQRILFHSVRTASADRVREMAAPRRYLALVCFLHQAWRDTLDQAVDMYGKLLDRNRKLVEDRLDDMLKAQRHAVDRIRATAQEALGKTVSQCLNGRLVVMSSERCS